MDSGDYRLFFGESSLGNGSKTSFPVNYAGTGKFSPQTPPPNGDPRLPLSNLSVLRQKMDSLQYFLSESVNHNTLLGKDQMNMVSFEITSAIHQVIVNGTALLSFSQNLGDDLVTINRNTVVQADLIDSVSSRVTDKVPVTDLTGSSFSKPSDLPVQTIYEFKPDVTVDMSYDEITTDLGAFRANQIDYSSWMSCRDSKEEEKKNEESEVVELDAVELLAEHVHRCEICGKGFKRDANLRMHMRAHGNQFKTAEALAKPDCVESSRKSRFSCPFMGCNRNKSHKKFQPLKSVICVKNHFKRSHCPKMYSCNRCNKKSFSVVSDLKSHVKHCGESKWRCSCGTTFSRKDKLFGHLALFEGHMPEVEDKAKEVMDIVEDDGKEMVDNEFGSLEYDGFDDWFDGLGGMDKDYLKDMLGSPPVEARMWESFGL